MEKRKVEKIMFINPGAKRLYNTLKKAVALRQYQRGFRKHKDGRPVTYCNVMARDVLDKRMPRVWVMGWLVSEYDYDIKAIRPEKSLIDIILNTDCRVAYDNLLKASQEKVVHSIGAYPAQFLANMGIPIHIITKEPQHEAIVCPDTARYNSKRGPRIGQAGWNNGIMYISDRKAWGRKWEDQKPLFILYPHFQKGDLIEYLT